MDFSKLGQNERLALGAAIVVIVTALISLNNDWGILMAVSLLAGLGALFVVFQPQMAPAMAMPMTRGTLLLALGAAATIATGLTTLNWIGWIFSHLVAFDTIQFIAGLVAAIVLLWAGWVAYQAEKAAGAATIPPSSPPPAAPPPASPPPASPPPAEPPPAV